MHREEIDKLRSIIAERGVTLVALSIFIKGHVAKVGLGLARGKRQYDTRRALMDKDMDREARRAMGTVR